MSRTILNKLQIALKINLFKTLYWNFHLFPGHYALKLPILIFKKVSIKHLKKENIIIKGDIVFGMIRIGVPNNEFSAGRTVFDIDGKLYINGLTSIGKGCYILVGSAGEMSMGKDFNIKQNSMIMARKRITFGQNCLISWNTTIMDTDWHKIYNKNEELQLNYDKPIIIGNNVWIGCNCTILKGTKVGNGNIIAANTCIHKSYPCENSIIGNNSVLKNNIEWKK